MGIPKASSQSIEATPNCVELTILMPCLNEAETIVTCINKAREFLDRAQIVGEILVSDNGSSDLSTALAVASGARLVIAPTRGYGAALKKGISEARGKFIVMGDADDSYDFSELDAFVQRLNLGADLVVGNRFVGGIAPGAMPFLHRYLGNPVLSYIGRLFFKSKIGDFHCGLRAFRKEAIERLELATDGMEFASEMLVKAAIKGLSVCEVPTRLSKDGRSRGSHLKTWQDGWRHLRFLLLHSPRWLFFYPGLIMSTIGFVVGVILLTGPIKVGTVVLGVHSLLVFSALFITGSQILFFSILARKITAKTRLLPAKSYSSRFLEKFSLEKLLLAGVLIGCLGVIGIVYSVIAWQNVGFGALDYERTMRLVIPSTTAIIFGIQMSFTAFFSDLIEL